MTRHQRKVAALGATTAILLATWVAGLVFSPERAAARSETTRLLAVKPESVASVRILSGGERLDFERSGDSWVIAEASSRFPAQSERVGNLLAALAAPRRLALVARSRESWQGFGLAEGAARAITLRDASGAVLADIHAGGYGPTGAELYLRRAGSDDSFVTESGFASYLSYGRKGWLDLRVVPGPLPEQDVQSISVRAKIRLDGKGKPPLALDFRLKRDEGGWTGPGGKVDEVRAVALVRGVLNLEAEDFAASPPADAFNPVALRIEIDLGSGGGKVIEVGAPSSEGRFYLRLAGTGLVHQVSAYTLRSLLIKPQ